MSLHGHVTVTCTVHIRVPLGVAPAVGLDRCVLTIAVSHDWSPCATRPAPSPDNR